MKSGCCNNAGGAPDLSLLTVPPYLVSSDAMSLLGIFFAGFVMVVGPFIKPMVCVLEYRGRLFTSWVGHKNAFNLYSCFCLLYSLATYISYHKLVQSMAYSPGIQTNQVLCVGYGVLVVGVTVKVSSLVSYGWNTIIGDYYFFRDLRNPLHNVNDGRKKKKGERTKEIKPDNYNSYSNKIKDPYYHPSGSSCVLVLVGYSLIMAKLSGLLICLLHSLSYVGAFLLERYLLQNFQEIGSLKLRMNVLWRKLRGVVTLKQNGYGGPFENNMNELHNTLGKE